MARTTTNGAKPGSTAQDDGEEPKTAVETPALVRQPHGGALLTGGVPGNKGGSGRPPNWLREKADLCLSNDAVWTRIEEIVSRRYVTLESGEDGEKAVAWVDNRSFMDAVKWLADRAHGKPKESVDVRTEIGAVVERVAPKFLLPPLDRPGDE